jgi:S1-C subfamily serine protease
MATRIWLGTAAALLFACLAFAATWQGAGSVPARFFASEAVAAVPASSHVKVLPEKGHGSGTHIGNGYVLTAAHVVGKATTVTVQGDNGASFEAEVLWANHAYDVALLRVDAGAALGVTPLSCAPNFAGQKVRAFGNPQMWEFVYTSGEVIGPPREHGPWASVLPMDMTIIPGQSGGALVADGHVVGIAVGVMVQGYGLAGVSYAVPAKIACDLMGRA